MRFIIECGKLVKERGAGSALPPLMFCSIACRDSAARPFPVPPPLLPPAGAAAPAAAAARPPCPGPGSERRAVCSFARAVHDSSLVQHKL